MGENTVNILSEESIKVYLTYMEPLKELFRNHIHQNLNSDRIVSNMKTSDSNFIILSQVMKQRHIED